jgi:hypothetical protein
MKLFELFNSNTNFKLVDESGNVLRYDFEVNGVEFHANFEQDVSGWHFDFQDVASGHGITNKGNAIAVFATAKNILFDAIKRTGATEIFFTADEYEGSRLKLYDRFLKMMEKQGWQIRKESNGLQTAFYAERY